MKAEVDPPPFSRLHACCRCDESCENIHVALQEEEEREREMKQLEVARYQQEMKLAQKEAEEEKIRRKQAYLKWVPSHAQELMHVQSTFVICCTAVTVRTDCTGLPRTIDWSCTVKW